jgi:hypothetical protein
MKYVLYTERDSIEGWSGGRIPKPRLKCGGLAPKALKAIGFLGKEGLDVRFSFFKTRLELVYIVPRGKPIRSKSLCKLFYAVQVLGSHR